MLTFPLLALLGLASATPEIIQRNLNYRSPYVSHPALAIDTEDVHRRHLVARAEVKSELRKRQATQAIPSGTPEDYPTAGYGLGVADWANADLIYAGELNYTHSVASGGFRIDGSS